MNAENVDDVPDDVVDQILTKQEQPPIQTTSLITNLEELDIDAITERAEKHVEKELILRKLALKVTNVQDWIDQNGKPYLQWTGASRVARILGVSYTGLHFDRVDRTDKHGEFCEIDCFGTIHWMGGKIEEIGSCSSRDPLFGVRKDENEKPFFLPLSEVDATDVKKKSLTNFLNRGLKSMVGLSFTWDEISEISGGKITRELVNAVKYKKRGSGQPAKENPEERAAASKNGAEVWSWLTEMHGKDATTALQALTTWTDNSGRKVAGKKKIDYVSPAQMKVLYPKAKKLYNEWKKSNKSSDGFTEGVNLDDKGSKSD